MKGDQNGGIEAQSKSNGKEEELNKELAHLQKSFNNDLLTSHRNSLDQSNVLQNLGDRSQFVFLQKPKIQN